MGGSASAFAWATHDIASTEEPNRPTAARVGVLWITLQARAGPVASGAQTAPARAAARRLSSSLPTRNLKVLKAFHSFLVDLNPFFQAAKRSLFRQL